MLKYLFLLFLLPFDSVQGVCELGDDVINMTSWTGSVSSPGKSRGMYPSDQTCYWELTVSQGSRVRLTFTEFQLEEGFRQNTPPQGPKICKDAVKITDDDEVLFSGCGGDGAGQTFVSKGNFMSITFNSDESTENSGFTATYHGFCEKNVTADETLESPGYPGPPPDGVTCTWTVTSQKRAIAYIRPAEGTTQDPLPDCKDSPLSWKTFNEGIGERRKEKQLCRNDSAIVSQSDVIVTYDPKVSNVSWVGQLQVEFTTSNNCSQFCRNTDDCLAPRTMDAGDYRCICPRQHSGFNCEIYTDPCTENNCSGAGQCLTSSDGQSFTCQCDYEYTGTLCETKIDPCANFTCLNGGSCIPEGLFNARCECPEGGYEQPDCRTPPSPCLSGPCHNGGTCTLRGLLDFVCTCSSDFTGAGCTIRSGQPHCMAEVDQTVGSGLKWDDTLAGNHDTQPCPSGVIGDAQRNCMKDEQSPTGGLWRRPDLSDCVSPLLQQLARDSQALREVGAEEIELFNISRRLANVTSVLKEVTNQTLYPGDLLLVSDILSDISVGVVNARTLGDNSDELSKNFASSLDDILNPDILDVWKNARVELVENKVTSLLASAQSFSDNLVRRQSGAVASMQVQNPNNVEPTTILLKSTGDHVELQVTEWRNIVNDNLSFNPALTVRPGQPASSIVLPRDLLHIAHADGSDRSLRVYTGRFASVSPLLSLKEYRYIRNNDVNITKIVNSDVMSAEVLGLPKSAFSRLDHPVRVTLRLTDPKKRPDLKKYCVFMNMSTSDREKRWLDSGCNVEHFNDSHVTCLCYHLTNFAVLLDVFENAADFDEANSAALSYISYIGGSLSTLAAVVVIVVFQYFRLSSDRVRIHEQLAVSIIAVQILFLIGVGRTAADDSTPEWACKTVAILLHYSLTALFCWMLVEGLHLYVLLVKVFKRGSHLKKYCAIGWGVPFIVVGISVGVFYDKYGDGDLCWLNHELLLVCFVPTVCLVIIINTVILILVLRVMLRSMHSTAKANAEHQSSIRMSLKASAVLLPLLGLTWTLGFLAVDADGSKVMSYVFTYLFTITNSFQGVMFFVFHCLLNVDVHNAYERRYRQRKRPMSSLENTTRKSSEASTYLTDGSPTGKSTTKTNLSDMSALHRRPSVPHGRFLLFEGNCQNPYDPTHPAFDPTCPTFEPSMPALDPSHPAFDSAQEHAHSAFDAGRDVSFDNNTVSFDDPQVSDTIKIWRRSSVGAGAAENSFPPTLHRSASSPTRAMAALMNSSTARPDMAAFVDSMHEVLDRPSRAAVHFT